MTASYFVKDFMTTSVTTLSPEMEIVRALNVLIDKNISGAPVMDDSGDLVGMFTERDCMRVILNAAYHREYGGLVREIMATGVKVVTPNDSIISIARRFYDEPYQRYPVMDGDVLVGQISRSDVIRALGNVWK
jgi:CBS domain-containing protein